MLASAAVKLQLQLVMVLVVAGCGTDPKPDPGPAWPHPQVPAEPQREGDPAKGYDYLVLFTALAAGQDAEPNTQKKSRIYDTSKPGYGNGGHRFGEDLSADDRRALLEYLKTL